MNSFFLWTLYLLLSVSFTLLWNFLITCVLLFRVGYNFMLSIYIVLSQHSQYHNLTYVINTDPNFLSCVPGTTQIQLHMIHMRAEEDLYTLLPSHNHTAESLPFRWVSFLAKFSLSHMFSLMGCSVNLNVSLYLLSISIGNFGDGLKEVLLFFSCESWLGSQARPLGSTAPGALIV